MWQSQVEIEHNSVAYFNGVTTFNVLCRLIRYSCIFAVCVWVPPLMEVVHYSASNLVTQSNYTTECLISTRDCHILLPLTLTTFNYTGCMYIPPWGVLVILHSVRHSPTLLCKTTPPRWVGSVTCTSVDIDILFVGCCLATKPLNLDNIKWNGWRW